MLGAREDSRVHVPVLISEALLLHRAPTMDLAFDRWPSKRVAVITTCDVRLQTFPNRHERFGHSENPFRNNSRVGKKRREHASIQQR